MFFARFFSSLLPILAVLLAFTASIFFHELGHFIAAKIRKLEVPIFSFGFGPRLFSLHIGGSEFRLSLFPLGGFVSIPQLSPPKNPEDPSNLPPSTRIFSDKVFIALMGPIFNFIFAFFLALALFFYGVNFPPSFTHNSIGFVHPEITLDNGNTSPSPAYLAGLQTGDQICSIDGTPTSNFFDIIHGITLGKNRDQLGPISSISVLRNGQSLEFSVHPVLLKQSPQGHDAFRTIGIEPYQELIVAHVFDTSPAHCVGLKRGDQLLALDGHKIFSLSHLLKMLEQRDHGTLSIQRSGENIDLPIHAKKIPATLPIIRFTTDHGPFELVPVFDRRDRIEDPLLDRCSLQLLSSSRQLQKIFPLWKTGDIFIPHFSQSPTNMEEAISLLRNAMSLPISFSLNGQDYSLSAQTIDLIPPHFVLGFGAEFSDRDVLVHQSPFALMAQCIGLTFHSFQSLLSPSSDVHIHNLTGPAGILDSLHSFAKYDFRRLLWLLVLLNINLGILNLLPIPFLDGGLIALSCLEKLLGRDIPSRLINTAYACFFLFFVGLVLYLSFFDFNRILMRNDGRRDFLRWQRLRIPEQSFWNAHPCSSP